MNTVRVVCAWMLVVGATLLVERGTYAAARIESNVVYGMHSGLALLMDVVHPDQPNGYGIVVIPGSAWYSPMDFDAFQLKEGINRPYLQADALLDAGYTLFSINHRAAPRFRYPTAVEDAQRAVRFVRHHSDRFGVDPNHIGAFGDSSGGHLVSMLGVLDGNGTGSPIDSESSKVQAVVAMFPATDFLALVPEGRGPAAAISFLGTSLPVGGPESPEGALYREASPTTHVSSDDPPVLLIHGDADRVVPITQSELFRDGLNEANVPVQLIRISGGGHAGALLQGSNASDYVRPLVEWFDSHLRQ